MTNAGDSIKTDNAGWSFGGQVPEHFDSHVCRSVPLYQEGHDIICHAADYFISENSTIYDLGTSTGELLLQLATRHTQPGLKMIGIDREDDMLSKAKKKCINEKRISFELSEMTALELEKSDMIISYYTMQFVRPAHRQQVFNKIYNALEWGGVFFLFEKVRANDARFQDIMTGLYTDYKMNVGGYSAQEIMSKAASLKGVLEPFSTQGNFDLLSRAGFKDFMPIMKYICFEGIMAIK